MPGPPGPKPTSKIGDSKQGRPIALPFYLGVTMLGILLIALMLARSSIDIPNPFAQERVATEEAVNFWAEKGAALDVRGRDLVEAMAFWGGQAIDGCSAERQINIDCEQVTARIQEVARNMESHVAAAVALDPPESDPTVRAWLDAQVEAWREDLRAMRRLAVAARTDGYDSLDWRLAIEDFNENPKRESAQRALERMLPNREVITNVVTAQDGGAGESP